MDRGRERGSETVGVWWNGRGHSGEVTGGGTSGRVWWNGHGHWRERE